MSQRGAPFALLVAAIALLGALSITLFMHLVAARTVNDVQTERLKGAGETTAALLAEAPATAALLRTVLEKNALDGAYLLDSDLRVLADAGGQASGERVDLLRVDVPRVRRALGGEETIGFAYTLGAVPVGSGYFPVAGRDGRIDRVLALEAGQTFSQKLRSLDRARNGAVALAFVGALALGFAAARWRRLERARAEAAERAAASDRVTRLAAVAAHEIRNPLGIIRGAVELMQARSGDALGQKDRAALTDVLDEVARLKTLTDDLLDLSADRAMADERFDLAAVASAAVESFGSAGRGRVTVTASPPLPVRGDPSRIRQVLMNLLNNAAQAAPDAEIFVEGGRADGYATVAVRDQGPGVADSVKAQLFEPFVSGRAQGTGLGLALSRRIAERHRGALVLADTARGATFILKLPLEGES